jgi:hypothetical protein
MYFFNLVDRLDCFYNKCSQINPKRSILRFDNSATLFVLTKDYSKEQHIFLGDGTSK